MGSGNLGYAMKVPEAQPVALCDVYQPHLERAEAAAKKGGYTIKGVKDFREILADKSIDAVCISTPDHWHAYMDRGSLQGRQGCLRRKALLHVRGRRPEDGAGRAQVQARSCRPAPCSAPAATSARPRKWCRAGRWATSPSAMRSSAVLAKREGYGNPPDSEPPAGLDWEMWLGPAPKVPFNANRWGVEKATFPTFRYFWDYAGGAMTDWGVHLIDPMHQCFGEPMPLSVSAMGEQVLRAGQRRNAGHHGSALPISEVPHHLREPHVQSAAAVQFRRRHRDPRDGRQHSR